MSITKGKETISELQQRIAEYSGYKDQIIWDKIEADEIKILKKKIEEVFPDQKDPKLQKTIDNVRCNLFNNVWDQRKYTNGYLLSSIFYVAVTEETDFNVADKSTKFSLHPVFRTQKCSVKGDGNDTTNCCMIYIDEVGRIYENWKSYLNENVLPPGTMVLPLHGVYNFDDNRVELVKYTSPSSKHSSMKMVNNTLSRVSLPAAAVPLVALAVPVAAPVFVVSSLICGAAGVATAITSGGNLLDRSKHGQPINLSDPEARSSWIGVVGSSIGIGAMGSMKVVKSMAAAGKVTKGLETTVNALNVASLAVNGGGIVNGLAHLLKKRNDNEPIDNNEYVQIAASLVLFTHSVYNFQLASTIVDDARTGRISDYRKSLSNRQRKMFEKLSKETIRIRGNVNGKIDIIRTVNDMPDAKYLNDLYKTNKPLNQNNVRPAFASGTSKGITLNDQVTVDTSVLRQSVQHGQGPNILEKITEPIPQSNSSGNKIHFNDTIPVKSPLLPNFCGTNLNQTELNHAYLDLMIKEGIVFVSTSLQIALKQFGEKFFQRIMDIESFSEYIKHVYNNCGENILQSILNITKRFIDEILDEFRYVISTESIFYKIYDLLMKVYEKDFNPDCVKQANEILKMLQEHFKSKEPKPRQGSKVNCKSTYTVEKYNDELSNINVTKHSYTNSSVSICKLR